MGLLPTDIETQRQKKNFDFSCFIVYFLNPLHINIHGRVGETPKSGETPKIYIDVYYTAIL